MFTMEPLTDPHDGDLYEQWPHIELNNVMMEPEPELWRSCSNPGPSAPVTPTPPPQHNEMNTVATSTATATLGRFGDIAS